MISNIVLFFRSILKKNILIRNLARRYRSRKFGDLGWKKLRDEEKEYWSKINSLHPEKQVLVATSFGSEITITTVESLIAAALKVRGVEVDILLCDGLPACQLCDTTKFNKIKNFAKDGIPKSTCKECFKSGERVYEGLGFNPLKFSNYLEPNDYTEAQNILSNLKYDQISDYIYQEIKVGEHAVSGTCRFFAKATFDDEPNAEMVLRRYLSASILVVKAMKRLLKLKEYDKTVLNHGIYVPQGVIADVARNQKTEIITWNTAYKKSSFIFSHGDTYHHTMLTEPVSKWSDLNLNKNQIDDINKYIGSRASGKNDWISFNKSIEVSEDAIYNKYGLKKNIPIIGLLTNVAWDAQLHYPANAFPNMFTWIIETINYIKTRKDLQLLIRIHPAEVTGHLKSRQTVLGEITKSFPTLPNNVILILPNDKISTYTLMQKCDSVLIYGTKTGVELSTMGIPVIVAGEAWIRNKGITRDIVTMQDYISVLNKLPLKKKLSRPKINKAIKYAYHFFNRRMIPVNTIKHNDGIPPFVLDIENIKNLEEGYDIGLDIICDGIINGNEFIYPAEIYNDKL